MFCPKCKSEFRDGFVWCKKYEVELVIELSPEEPKLAPRYVELVTETNPARASLIQSILEAEGIPFHVKGGFNTRNGSRFFILVADNEYDHAIKILESIN